MLVACCRDENSAFLGASGQLDHPCGSEHAYLNCTILLDAFGLSIAAMKLMKHAVALLQAIYDSQKPAELLSLNMTGVLCVYRCACHTGHHCKPLLVMRLACLTSSHLSICSLLPVLMASARQAWAHNGHRNQAAQPARPVLSLCAAVRCSCASHWPSGRRTPFYLPVT